MNRRKVSERALRKHYLEVADRAASVEVHNPSGDEYGWKADVYDHRGYYIGGTSGVPLDVAQEAAYMYAIAITERIR